MSLYLGCRYMRGRYGLPNHIPIKYHFSKVTSIIYDCTHGYNKDTQGNKSFIPQGVNYYTLLYAQKPKTSTYYPIIIVVYLSIF